MTLLSAIPTVESRPEPHSSRYPTTGAAHCAVPTKMYLKKYNHPAIEVLE
jgi:hypothetical protein